MPLESECSLLMFRLHGKKSRSNFWSVKYLVLSTQYLMSQVMNQGQSINCILKKHSILRNHHLFYHRTTQIRLSLASYLLIEPPIWNGIAYMQPFWYLHRWAFMLLKHFLLYLSHAVDITHGINFLYTTAMNSQWTITQYFFASKRPGLGNRKHTTCLMKIISNHKPWEIQYVHYSIYVYYTTLLDWRFLKHHYWTLRHQYVNPAATLLHKKKENWLNGHIVIMFGSGLNPWLLCTADGQIQILLHVYSHTWLILA